MVQYNCPRCGYNSKYKNDIRRHYSRKKICKVTINEVSIKYCIANIDNPGKSVSELDIMKNKLEQKDKEIEELKKKQGSVINNTINNYNIININSFKDTDYASLKDDILFCIENQDPNLKVPMFEQIVDKIHFNKDKPENHNIYKPNVRDDRILTYNGDDFIIDKNAVETILTKLEKTIENNFNPEENRNILNKLREHLKLKRDDGDYIEATKDDIGVVMYNGRKIVKDTHKNV